MNKGIQYTKQIILTGLFLALALVIREFSYMVYIGGAPGMRISFAGIFIKFPALLFGPLFGGIAGGLLDFLGFIIKPEGAFIPWLTVTAVLGGILTGFLWNLLKEIDVKKVFKSFLISFTVIGFLGLANHIIMTFLPGTFWAKFIELIGKSKDFATIGLETTALIGLLLLAVDFIIKKINSNIAIHENYLKLLIAIGAAGVIVTTLNTYILQLFIPALAKKGFMLFWIPRLVQELLMTVIQAYVVSFLLSVYQRFRKSS